MNEFRVHITDAIKINLNRLPKHARVSHGLSIPISLLLILFEITILPIALYYDLVSRKWYRVGRKVMVDDFISMKEINQWNHKIVDEKRPKKFFLNVGAFRMRASLINLLIQDKWEEADRYLSYYRENLEEKASHQLFLYKHFLESIHRSLRLTVLWNKEQELERKLKLQRRSFILMQALGLDYCLFLDILAYPLYKKGSGIIRNDIPEIPVPESI